MFDYVRCKWPLPDGAPTEGYQTKDTPAQYLDTYEIREDGSLWTEEYDYEDRSDPTKTGLGRFVGCMTRVNVRQVPCNYTGQINFYGDGWDFLAFFARGQMTALLSLADPAEPLACSAGSRNEPVRRENVLRPAY